MTQHFSTVTLLSLGLCTMTVPASAQTLLSGDHSVDGSLCAGSSCTSSESFVGADFKIKTVNPEFLFDDTSSVNAPDRDWRILTNENGQENLIIEDVTALRDVFLIEGGAPASGMYLANTGRLGLGTSIPLEEIHIAGSSSAAIRMDVGTSGDSWNIRTNTSYWWVEREPEGNFPFVIADEAPDTSFWMVDSGDIGFGTETPEGKFHTVGDGVQLFFFESGDGGPVQMRFRSDSQNRRFLATNNADEVQTQMQFRDNEILFLGATAADEWLRVDASGITTMGGTCNVNPCDRTFDTEYFKVPPIEERAAYMWENMHLPAVGPTKAGEPINLTEKTTGMLHELEVAHIYIEQLHGEIAQIKHAHDLEMNAVQSQLLTVLTRLDSLETR